MSFAQMLTSTVTVKRITRTADAYGSWTESEDILLTDVPCRLQALRGNERALYGKLQVEADYKLFCLPQDEEIKEADVVYYGTRKFTIVFVDDWDFQSVYLRLYLQERK